MAVSGCFLYIPIAAGFKRFINNIWGHITHPEVHLIVETGSADGPSQGVWHAPRLSAQATSPLHSSDDPSRPDHACDSRHASTYEQKVP